MSASGPGGLVALAVDDEAPALDELAFLLRTCPVVARSQAVGSAEAAMALLGTERFDVVLADVRMPGLDGLGLAAAVARLEPAPAVVFVTAHEDHALDAFGVGAAGYLLKPLDAERLATVLRRLGAPRASDSDDLESLAVEGPGRTVLVARRDVEWVEAAGDYVRLHTGSGHGQLVRIPISLLEERWGPHGFVRIHRSYLVSLAAVRELRSEGTTTVLQIGPDELPVARRHVHELRDRLVRDSKRRR